MKQEQGISLGCFLSTNQSTRSRFIRSLIKMAGAEGHFEERFQKRCYSSLLLMIMVRFSLDTGACACSCCCVCSCENQTYLIISSFLQKGSPYLNKGYYPRHKQLCRALYTDKIISQLVTRFSLCKHALKIYSFYHFYI